MTLPLRTSSEIHRLTTTGATEMPVTISNPRMVPHPGTEQPDSIRVPAPAPLPDGIRVGESIRYVNGLPWDAEPTAKTILRPASRAQGRDIDAGQHDANLFSDAMRVQDADQTGTNARVEPLPSRPGTSKA